MAPSAPLPRPRGTARREALIRAAADLVLEHGLVAATHRAVATRAELPLASTTYHFDSVDNLRDEALGRIAARWSAAADAAVDALPARLDADDAAHGIAAVIGTGAGAEHVLLLYERYLEAGRHGRLRPLVGSWNAHARALVRRVLLRASLPGDDATARLVLAAADGAAVAALAEGDHPGEAVRAAVGRLLSLLAADGSG